MLPRFTSYVGAGTFATVPLEVTEFERAHLVFWRGPLVGGALTQPFVATFEESHDAYDWTEADLSRGSQPVDTDDTEEPYTVEFSKRWFRVKVVLGGDATAGVVGISLWMTGGMVRRVQ